MIYLRKCWIFHMQSVSGNAMQRCVVQDYLFHIETFPRRSKINRIALEPRENTVKISLSTTSGTWMEKATGLTNDVSGKKYTSGA